MKAKYQHFRIDRETGTLKPYHRPQKLADGTRLDRPFEPAERGGGTFCRIFSDDDVMIASGGSTCSLKDVFNYRIGRKIAFGRAMKELKRLEKSDAIS